MRVGVITTGKAELAGLHVALARLFPEHEFSPLPARRPDVPFNGVTSSTISETAPVDATRGVGDFADERRGQGGAGGDQAVDPVLD